MKSFLKILILSLLILTLTGCGSQDDAQIAATTLPVYQFSSIICQNTPLQVTRIINESVSCLHEYTLTVDQMRAIERSEVVVISGAGLEEFMEDLLSECSVIDSSAGIALLEGEEHDHEADHHSDGSGEEEHHHEHDPHIWLSPANAQVMAQNICNGLSARYPQYAYTFSKNLAGLLTRLEHLDTYADEALSQLSCRDLITFHDGFSYLAESCDLHILKAIEEESGREASASELKDTILLVRQYNLPAIFTERSGSVSAAGVISAETNVPVYCLDMAIAGDDYFESMYHNFDTLKEALQ